MIPSGEDIVKLLVCIGLVLSACGFVVAPRNVRITLLSLGIAAIARIAH
jgi:hypothetical protein